MKKSKLTGSEMVKAIQKLESGIQADVVARKYGISRATLYNWKSKYSRMEVSQFARLKELEDGNRRLKQMHADLALDNKILRDVIHDIPKGQSLHVIHNSSSAPVGRPFFDIKDRRFCKCDL